jgi:hypothetical protein
MDVLIAAWIVIIVVVVSPPSPAEERRAEMCKGGRGHGGNRLGANTAPSLCCGRAGKASKGMFSWLSLSTTSLKTVFLFLAKATRKQKLEIIRAHTIE